MTEQNQKQQIITTCGGTSNLGQLSFQGADAFCDKRQNFASHESLVKILVDNEYTAEKMDNKKLVVIDGCEKQCGKQAVEKSGYTISDHLTLTDLGLEKRKSANFTDDEFELVKDAIQACCAEPDGGAMIVAMGTSSCSCRS